MSNPNYPDDCPSPDFDPEKIYDAPPDYVSLRDAYLELRASLSCDTARLNSGAIILSVNGERVHFVAQDLRRAIDAANADIQLADDAFRQACNLVENRARSLGKECQIIFADNHVEVAPLSWSGSAVGLNLCDTLTQALKSREA